MRLRIARPSTVSRIHISSIYSVARPKDSGQYDSAQGESCRCERNADHIADDAQSMLNCIDNSGAAVVECVKVLKMKRAAKIGQHTQ